MAPLKTSVVTSFDQKAKICSPIIKEVFELAHNRKRLNKLGSRLIVSDKHVSILVKNPPAEATEEYGIFIDVIAVIVIHTVVVVVVVVVIVVIIVVITTVIVVSIIIIVVIIHVVVVVHIIIVCVVVELTVKFLV